VLGLGLALWGARFLESLLFEVDGRDPGVLVGVALTLLAVALLAAWIPARRATRIAPVEALRTE
jgi:ABC-type lipoprotein release transport system permease subunit